MFRFSVLTDFELTALLKLGDQGAFTEIYERFWKKLLQIAWNHTKDKKMSEDMVHEVFMSLWERKEKLDIADVGAFLATSVKYTVFKNYQRESRRSKLAELNYPFNNITDDEEKLDAIFLREYIDGIVEKLPEKCKMVFRYSREKGLKNAEIAAEMNITEKGVEANLTRALKMIRGNLENSGILLIVAYHITKQII
jgi:RNA polymerase sigma-70 factor (ECF subfamily)